MFTVNNPRSARRSPAVLVSAVLHGAAILGFTLCSVDAPRPAIPSGPRKYPIRFIRLQMPKPVRPSLPLMVPPVRAHGLSGEGPTHRGFKLPPGAQLHLRQAKQTILQPDLPSNVVLERDIPIPNLAWTPRQADAPSVTRPSMAVQIPKLSLPAPSLPPSPIVENVVTLSDNPLRFDTVVALPPANQIAASDAADAVSGPATPAVAPQTSARSEAVSEPRAPASSSPATGPGDPPQASVTRIALPKDGKFAAVVLGSSPASAYPESADTLTGDTLYTVYLRVGLPKSWILQYCLAKNSGVSDGPVDAPWAFSIFRPDQLSALDLDYVMVRGIINSQGRFEQLALVYPSELKGKDFLLDMLRQWEFRPANRDGQAVAVEALLIIPRREE